MKYLIYCVVFSSIMGIFTACENEEVWGTLNGDAFIITKIEGGDTIYGLALHAFGNIPFTHVEAIAVEGNSEPILLKSYMGYANDYFYESGNVDYSEELPTVGEYDFSANFINGDADESNDVLTDEVIYPATIIETEFTDIPQQINIVWETPARVDYYVITLSDESGKTVFNSVSVNADATTFSINTYTVGWVNSSIPEQGATYKLELNAYMYEPGETGLDIQARSVTGTTFAWGN